MQFVSVTRWKRKQLMLHTLYPGVSVRLINAPRKRPISEVPSNSRPCQLHGRSSRKRSVNFTVTALYIGQHSHRSNGRAKWIVFGSPDSIWRKCFILPSFLPVLFYQSSSSIYSDSRTRILLHLQLFLYCSNILSLCKF